MEIQSLREQILQIDRSFSVVIADNEQLIDSVYRLRYQVYSVERGFEPGDNGVEIDKFDERARHVLLIHRETGQPVGTVRVIPSSYTDGVEGLPMASACAPGLLQHLPSLTTGEISRFALSKLRSMSCRAGTMLRLGLMKGVIQLSSELGLTHWCAIMEPTLIRLLQAHSIHYVPVGPLVEYHGLRQPCYAEISSVVERGRAEKWETWNYCTRGGALLRNPDSEVLAA
jgi:N-acyl-L-homoserine lactone synthetase